MNGGATGFRMWGRDEKLWGRDCLRHGDSVVEIAEMAGCSREEVVANIGPGALNAHQREIVSLYRAGAAYRDINRAIGARSRVAESTISELRRHGYPIPHRRECFAHG